ncbi:non-ribosomal peptide synthetase [Streptomyces sp. NEAU-L66]|uniref:non-ribosomal peptide synthetase n=1 Tax=Streptomyces sp. NEAU-L66 TaxID=3390812 RepID=UPI0039C5C255
MQPMSTPLSRASQKEEALWLLDKLVPDSGVNNIPAAIQVAGRLRTTALREAAARLLRKHEVLRTVFHDEGAGLRKAILAPEDAPVDIEVSRSTADGLADDLTALAARPFKFNGRPMLRICQVEAPEGDVLCVVAHHLVFDVASAQIVMGELTRLYDAVLAGEDLSGEAVVPVAAVAADEPRPESFRFWRDHLSGFDAGSLDLWMDRQGSAETTLKGATVAHDLSDEARDVVRRLRRELRASEPVILLAAYYLLLAQHGAGPDIVIGSPADIRGQQAAGAIGYYVNILALRVRTDPAQSFRALVRQARDVFLEAVSHVDVHVDLLLPEIPRVNSAWSTTLFRHMFNYLPGGLSAETTIGGLPARALMVRNGYSRMNLEFDILSEKDRITVEALYGLESHRRDDVALLLQRYDALLVAVGAEPDRPVGELSSWSERDRTVIAAANRTATDTPAPSVLRTVAERVAAAPDAVALADGDRKTTYAELWQAASDTRELLCASGVTAGDVVAVAARRGPELAAAALGVWLAGCAYLPVDPDHPADRISYQLADSGARAVLAGDTVTLPEGTPRLDMAGLRAVRGGTAELPADPDPASCAYLIYTSGSTGRPKGTRVSHGNLANLVRHFLDELKPGPGQVTLWMTTFAFDISALELFLPLASGGTLAVAPDEARVNGTVLRELLVRHDVAVMQATPTTWRTVIEQVGDQLSGRRVLCGGEALPADLAQRLLETAAEVRNVYGPTETTIWSTAGKLDAADGAVHAGTPLRNTTAFVLDPAGRELPLGVHGELCIAGAGVAIGYHNRPELTAERFGEHPEYGRFYRTGDLARWRDNGTLEVLGRVDRQIKLRGNRLELAEIEAVLREHPEVTGAAVVTVGDLSADAVLVAFVVAHPTEGIVERLWEHARAKLPSSAVPHDFVLTDELPTNANEKVDYPHLTRLATARRAAAGHGAAAEHHEDPLVDALLSMFRELLGREDVTADANFFVLGGHSLLAALLVQRIQESFGAEMRLAEFFALPTPLGLAAFLRSRGVEPGTG